MATVKIAKRHSMDKEEVNKPGKIPSRLRGEFFTEDYAKLFEEEGERLYKDILSELVGGEIVDDVGATVTVKGKLPELFEKAVERLSQTLKHKKGIDGLKDNAQFFAPWIKGLVNDISTSGMKKIMESLEGLAHEHSVRVVDESLLDAPIPDILSEEDAAEDMAIPEIAETPEIPELEAGDVEGWLKGTEVPEAAVAAPPPPPVAPATPPPQGAAPGAPVAPILPAPQATSAASRMKDVRRNLIERRRYRTVVSTASANDLLRAAAVNLKLLEDDNA